MAASPIRRMGTSVEDGWRESSRPELLMACGLQRAADDRPARARHPQTRSPSTPPSSLATPPMLPGRRRRAPRGASRRHQGWPGAPKCCSVPLLVQACCCRPHAVLHAAHLPSHSVTARAQALPNGVETPALIVGLCLQNLAVRALAGLLNL